MENNVLNALDFLLKSDSKAQEAVDNGYDISRMYSDEEWLLKMVAYASQITPTKLEQRQATRTKIAEVLDREYETRPPIRIVVPSECSNSEFAEDWEKGDTNGFNRCLDLIKRLNHLHEFDPVSVKPKILMPKKSNIEALERAYYKKLKKLRLEDDDIINRCISFEHGTKKIIESIRTLNPGAEVVEADKNETF